ncbi:hypothetical protein Tco_0027062 [Tanacetum coccineum]
MRKVWKPMGKVFTEIRYSWKPTSRNFTIIGNRCPLTRITSNKIVPPKETTIAPVVTPTSGILVYSKRPKATRSVGPNSKVKIVESKTSNSKEHKKSWGSTVSDVPSSSLNDCRLSKLFSGTVRFGKDRIAKITGYGDYQIGWQIPNNNNGWLDEDDDEEPEEDEADEDNNEEIEEKDEEMEDEEEEEIVVEEEAEIIYPYDEVDPNNRPPPALDDESEFAPSVVPVFDAENRPVPYVLHFSSTYKWGKSSSAREILKDIGNVSPLGPMPPTISTDMSRIRKLNEQMREQAKVDERIVKKMNKSDLRIRMVGRDAMNVDCVVRECQADVSKVISMMENTTLEFDRVRKESRQTLELVENVAIADNDVKDDDVENDDVEDDDMDDDDVDPSDL